MPVEQVKVPRAGESISEVTINRWLKADGAYVKVDDPLVELGTDKATQELAAPVAGVLKTLVKEGEVVAVDALIAQINTDAKAPAAQANPERERGGASRAERGEGKSSKAVPSPGGEAPPPSPARGEGGKPDGIPSPAAARVLAEAGLTPSDVTGTGPGGRITKGDALAASQETGDKRQETPQKPANGPVPSLSPGSRPLSPDRPVSRQPMTQIRRRIAERLLESQNTTATLTTFNECDMSAVMELRAKYNDRFEKKHGVKLGFMSVFVKAAVEALRAFPLVNSRIDGTDVVTQHYYDIGVAVSTEKGLMVPVLRGADRLNFADIEKRIAELAKKARDGKITVTDLEGGTFTITNGGIFGSMLSTPILNPPQSAILGMHNITKRAVVVNDQIVIRPMMYLALSYDHRLIDGREAVQFLVAIKECVENPGRMLLEV
jgi:2-oxoglutarate dehydrogenase E2 component (dihydrolipoamide succinyltransferase)